MVCEKPTESNQKALCSAVGHDFQVYGTSGNAHEDGDIPFMVSSLRLSQLKWAHVVKASRSKGP